MSKQKTTERIAINGYDWEIKTSKYKNEVACYALACKISYEAGYRSISFMMYEDPYIKLHEVEGRAIEKTITAVHEAGLAEFDRRVKDNTLPYRKIKAA